MEYLKSLNRLREADHLVAAMPKGPERLKLQRAIGKELSELINLQEAESQKPGRLSSGKLVKGPLLNLSAEAQLKSMESPGGDNILEVGPLFFVYLEEQTQPIK